jgi:hypothetical protein
LPYIYFFHHNFSVSNFFILSLFPEQRSLFLPAVAVTSALMRHVNLF